MTPGKTASSNPLNHTGNYRVENLLNLRILTFLNRMPIRNRLIVFFLLVSIVPIFLMGLISYNNSKAAITTKIVQYSVGQLTQTSGNLTLDLKQYEDFIMQFIAKQETNQLIWRFVNGYKGESTEAALKIRDIFQTETDLNNVDIAFYAETGNRFICSGANNIDFIHSTPYIVTRQKAGRTVWSYYQRKLVLSRVINSPVTKEPLGVIAVFIDENRVNRLINSFLYSDSNFSESTIKEGPYSIIIDTQGKIIVSPFANDLGKNVSLVMQNSRTLDMLKAADNVQGKFWERIGGKEVLVTFSLMPYKNWYLLGISPSSYLYAESSAVGWWALLLGILISVIAVIISFIVAIGISVPLNQVMSAMKQAENDLSVRVNLNTKDELGELGNRFNRMISRINDLTQLAQAYTELKENHQKMLITEKMASLGRLTAGIAHEMNTPLAAVRAAIMELHQLVDELKRSIGNPQVLPEDYRAIAEDISRNLKIAEQAAEKSASFIRGIKGQTIDLTSTPLQIFLMAPVIKDTLNIIEFALRKSQCQMITDIDESIQITGNPRWLSQIIVNLVLNAIDACKPKGGTILIILKPGVRNTVKLEVHDNGCGIPSENLSRIFDPMFTTKPFGEGTGFGLSIVLDLVNQFKGTIEVTSQPGQTIFTITVPLP